MTVPLIPRRALFGNPDRAACQISPDGACIGFLAPREGVLNVWVAPADDPSAARPVTDDKVRGIRHYFWAYTSRHIIYQQDQAGDENWRVYSVNLDTDEVRDLTPLEGVQARITSVSDRFPREILVSLNDRDPELHDLYRVNLETGERQLVVQNDEGFVGFMPDHDYRVRFALRMLPDGAEEVLQPQEGGGWDRFALIPNEDALTTHFIGCDKGNQSFYLFDSRGRSTAAAAQLDLKTGQLTVLAEDPRADISGALTHPTEKHLQAVSSTYERERWQVLDPALAGDLEYLRGVADGDLEVLGRSQDDRRWTVAFVVDNGPVRYYLYDREAKQARFLFSNRQALEGLTLARTHPAVIASRDGLNLVSYLTLPVGSDAVRPGRPEQPLPMVLMVHGGPWGRDEWGYNPFHQWLANRGYAVLSVNFRGSTGFGKAFVNAADREWAGKMHDDLVDAVRWAIEEKIADPTRIAIMGGSYGGYSTLVGLTFTPALFACGVDLVGPSNLVTLLSTIPPYWKPMISLFRQRVGDNTTEEGRALLTERSPLTHVDRICRPLLIGQGANDPRVKQAESDQIVQAMQEKGIPVTYLLYSDEGHGFVRPENNLSFFAVAEAFLAEHLGGRFEPVGEDFGGSSIQVVTGGEQVPGLAAALAT
jgi:dipeptidyl aminopeptidase/acylaminoacyl peptidase